jgi:hypothetical protein
MNNPKIVDKLMDINLRHSEEYRRKRKVIAVACDWAETYLTTDLQIPVVSLAGDSDIEFKWLSDKTCVILVFKHNLDHMACVYTTSHTDSWYGQIEPNVERLLIFLRSHQAVKASSDSRVG